MTMRGKCDVLIEAGKECRSLRLKSSHLLKWKRMPSGGPYSSMIDKALKTDDV